MSNCCNTGPSVGTVDLFQAQERDIRRINEGMTRARRKLLLVGDPSTLRRYSFFVELLAYVKGVGATALRVSCPN